MGASGVAKTSGAEPGTVIESVKKSELDPDRKLWLEEWFDLLAGIDLARRDGTARHVEDAPSFETYCEHRKAKTWGRFARETWPGREKMWVPWTERGEANGQD